MGSAAAAWTAGFVEGEGCLLITKKGYISLEVEQVDPTPLFRLHVLWGGNVNKRRTRNCWRWTIAGDACNNMLSAIHRLMVGNKAIQALLVMNHFEDKFADKRPCAHRARRALSALKGTNGKQNRRKVSRKVRRRA